MKDAWTAITAWVSSKGHGVDALRITVRMKGAGMNMARPL